MMLPLRVGVPNGHVGLRWRQTRERQASEFIQGQLTGQLTPRVGIVMKKSLKWCLFSLILMTSLLAGFPSVQAATTPKVKGLILDNARQFYSVNSIKQLIDEVQAGGGSFVQLHLTDDTRFGVESAKLGQTVKKARKVGTTYYNRQTKLAFLSKKQLRSLIVYGHQRGIEVIPEIDTPGHSKALVKLMKTSSKANRKLAKTIVYKNAELKMDHAKTKPFVKSLLSEYVKLQYRGQHIGIGGDEYGGTTAATQPAMVSYANYLNRYLNKKHLKATMWNDGFMTKDLPRIDHNILVTYWSYDGQTSNAALAAKHRQIRASMPALNAAGFQTINANYSYLYIITNAKMFKASNVAYWQNDLLTHWNSTVWDNWNHTGLTTSANNLGSAISIWGDGRKSYSQASILRRTQPFFNTYFNPEIQ